MKNSIRSLGMVGVLVGLSVACSARTESVESYGATKQADMQSFVPSITVHRAKDEYLALPFVQQELCVLTRVESMFDQEAGGADLVVDIDTERWTLRAWGNAMAEASCIPWSAFTIWGGGTASPLVSRPSGWGFSFHDASEPYRLGYQVLWDDQSFCALSGITGSWDGNSQSAWIERESSSFGAPWHLAFAPRSRDWSGTNAMCHSFGLGRSPVFAGGEAEHVNLTPELDQVIAGPGEPVFCFLTQLAERGDGNDRIEAHIDHASDGRQYLGGHGIERVGARCLYWIQ